jgi:uncharacterized protein with HEPN domain
MSRRRSELYLLDILIAIEKIERYHRKFSDAESFYHDDMSFDATMRELQIIGEATKHLLRSGTLDDSHRVIVDFRNLIVHEYFGVDAEEIWEILREELPPFRGRVEKLLKLSDRDIVLEILEELSQVKRGNTKSLLEKWIRELKESK